MKKSPLPYALFVALLAVAVDPHPAHAYLDPGTGSYTAQVLFAGLLVGAFSVRNFVRRVFDSLFRGVKK